MILSRILLHNALGSAVSASRKPWKNSSLVVQKVEFESLSPHQTTWQARVTDEVLVPAFFFRLRKMATDKNERSCKHSIKS